MEPQLPPSHKNANGKENVYIETMDSLHFHLYHSTKQQEQDSKTNNDDHADQYIDMDFKRMVDLERKLKQKANRVSRLSTNKYDISMVPKPVYQVKADSSSVNVREIRGFGKTFLDSIYSRLLAANDDTSNLEESNGHRIWKTARSYMNQYYSKGQAYYSLTKKYPKFQPAVIGDIGPYVQKLQHIMDEEEYCTESLEIDLKLRSGNISRYLNNSEVINLIKTHFKTAKSYFLSVYPEQNVIAHLH